MYARTPSLSESKPGSVASHTCGWGPALLLTLTYIKIALTTYMEGFYVT